jgi:TDG/mug DNA glycosylase family protein
MSQFHNPRATRAELEASRSKTLKDILAPNLKVLFCGINPGLYSAFTGHHFARPGNRFWPALHAGGFTSRLLHPSEERLILEGGYGITNVVDRATAAADELDHEEFRSGGAKLQAKVKRYQPRYLAVLGVGAYRVAFNDPKAKLGLQAKSIGETKVWVLPSPSGLNAHYRSQELATLFRQLHDVAEADEG